MQPKKLYRIETNKLEFIYEAFYPSHHDNGYSHGSSMAIDYQPNSFTHFTFKCYGFPIENVTKQNTRFPAACINITPQEFPRTCWHIYQLV